MPTLTKTSEPKLVARAQAGEFAAFEDLVKRYEGQLYGLALKILKTPADAEDVVQNTFLQAINSLANLRDGAAFGTWLKRIATNHALQLLRRRRGLPMVSLDALTESDDQDWIQTPKTIAEWTQTPAALAHRRDVRELLQQALEELPESYRLVFTMRDIHDLSTRETAQVLEISPANVKVRLLRARLALREKLTRVLGDLNQHIPSTHDHGGGVDGKTLLNLYQREQQEVSA